MTDSLLAVRRWPCTSHTHTPRQRGVCVCDDAGRSRVIVVEWTRAALYHVLVTVDPLANIYHHPITAAFVGHYFTALGPAIGRYREPADQDRFAREEAARFLALLAQAERERAARLEEPYLRLVPPPGDGEADGR